MNWKPPAAINTIAENNVDSVKSDGLRTPKPCAKNWVVTAKIEKTDQIMMYAAVKTAVLTPLVLLDDIFL